MELDDHISNKLLVYQIDHTKNLLHILSTNITALDASDTGTGKTYSAIAVCAQLKLNPVIICPKSVISSWTKVCKTFNVTPFMIVNYETIKYGKYYVNNKRMKCPYITVTENKETNKTEFKWNFNEKQNIIFIFDEVHKCSNIETLNGQLLYHSKNEDIKMLLLSATIADKPEKFRLFFYVLNFIDPKQVTERKMTYNNYMQIMHKWILRDAKPMIRIYNMLYPQRSSRMKIDVLGDLFPETQIIAEPYFMGDKRAAAIEHEYKIIAMELEKLKQKGKTDKRNILVKILRAHQKIEILKIPTFVELTNDYIENGFSVVIFVNFTQTLETLADMLHTDCLIYGEQTSEQRDKNINKFQENKTKIIISNIKSGGVGISLHDIYGGHPRVSLISPTWDAVNLVQALGRIHRAGSKSKSLQRIIYADGTIESKIADKIQKKLKDINSLNNGDVDLTNILFEKERKTM